MNKKLAFEVGVKAVIADGNGNYLLLKRADAYVSDIERGLGHKRRWDLPGGRTESGEAVQDGLKREVLEETNLKVKRIIRVIDVHDSFYHEGFHTVRIYFEVTATGNIKVSNEHSEAKWFTVEEIKELQKEDNAERSTAKLFADLAQW